MLKRFCKCGCMYLPSNDINGSVLGGPSRRQVDQHKAVRERARASEEEILVGVFYIKTRITLSISFSKPFLMLDFVALRQQCTIR